MENDLISRSALFEKIQPVDFLYGDDEAPAYSGMAVSAGDIESAPAVDAVEAVKCEDCQYAEPYMRMDGQTGYYCNHPKNTFNYGPQWEHIFQTSKRRR